MTELLTDPPPAADPAASPVDDPAAQGWRRDKQQRWFTPAKGRSGVVYRQGTETLEEAHARDAKGPKDRKPKAKPKVPKAPAPTQVSLKELEFALTEALSAPSMIGAMQGEEYIANHFVQQAPILARNLVKAAEHNPWLRSKLEATMSGDVFLMRIMTLFPVAAAAVAYTLPPIIYYFDPPFISEPAREMFQVPKRDKQQREERDAPPTPPASAAASEAPGPVAAAA